MPVSEPAPGCDIPTCFVDTCTIVGAEDSRCHFGQCVFTRLECSVTCNEAPPACPADTLPESDGGCWTGDCVATDLCDYVPDCSHCAWGRACVAHMTESGTRYACEDIPDSCGGAASCGCMGDRCEAPYDTCTNSSQAGRINCSCPDC